MRGKFGPVTVESEAALREFAEDAPRLIYAGIGSRETPKDVLVQMTRLATMLTGYGWTLRSGGAPGADSAFEQGVDGADVDAESGSKQIFLPWNGFQGRYVQHDIDRIFTPPKPEAFEIAKAHHPTWLRCNDGARKLHARNSHIVLGWNLDDPVKFVLCWTPGAAGGGGTGQALRVAKRREISIFDTAGEGWMERLSKFLEKEPS